MVSVLFGGRLISGMSLTRHIEGQHLWSATSCSIALTARALASGSSDIFARS